MGLRRTRRAGQSAVSVGVVVALLALAMLATGCNRPWRDKYFDKGLRTLTQTDVQEMMGPPHTSKTSLLGELSVWTYRFPVTDEELDPMGSFGNAAMKAKQTAAAAVGQGKEGSTYPTLRCVKYTLKFDKDKLLQEWKRDPCTPQAPATP